MEQEELIKKIADILESLKVPYIITGGIAVVVWGRPRFTADVNIVIELLPQKLDELAEKLKGVDRNNMYVDKEMMVEALRREDEFNVIHAPSGLKIDFWILKKDEFNKERMRRRVKTRIVGADIYVISPEDLILSKLQWYKIGESTRQLEDIESVIAIQEKIDWSYLLDWSEKQGTREILEKLKNKVENEK